MKYAVLMLKQMCNLDFTEKDLATVVSLKTYETARIVTAINALTGSSYTIQDIQAALSAAAISAQIQQETIPNLLNRSRGV